MGEEADKRREKVFGGTRWLSGNWSLCCLKESRGLAECGLHKLEIAGLRLINPVKSCVNSPIPCIYLA